MVEPQTVKKTTSIGDFLYSLDSERSGRNRANLAHELGLHNSLSTSVDEDEAQIVYRVRGFKIGEVNFEVGFNNPGTCEVAVLLTKICELYGNDSFMLDTKTLLVIRTYFGSTVFRRIMTAQEQKVYDVPLHMLLTSGEQEVSIQRAG